MDIVSGLKNNIMSKQNIPPTYSDRFDSQPIKASSVKQMAPSTVQQTVPTIQSIPVEPITSVQAATTGTTGSMGSTGYISSIIGGNIVLLGVSIPKVYLFVVIGILLGGAIYYIWQRFFRKTVGKVIQGSQLGNQGVSTQLTQIQPTQSVQSVQTVQTAQPIQSAQPIQQVQQAQPNKSMEQGDSKQLNKPTKPPKQQIVVKPKSIDVDVDDDTIEPYVGEPALIDTESDDMKNIMVTK